MESQQTKEDKTAAEKYEKFREIDPFPQIQSSLLNSADIENYVNATGMICPFDKNDLKSASYAARIKGECIFWDKDGTKVTELLSGPHSTFTLEPNSIAFIEVEPTFRLPSYIALRFNLIISNVYRGLLLGTGPLVDPGFKGKLYIPLHNLTTNKYTFLYGEQLIWIEFTKTSPIEEHEKYTGDPIEMDGEYVPFDKNKNDQPLAYYLNKACKGGKIRSSLPAINNEIRKMKQIGWGGLGVLLLSLIALLYPGISVQKSYIDTLKQLQSQVAILNANAEQSAIKVNDMTAYKSLLEARVAEQNIQIDRLDKEIGKLHIKVSGCCQQVESSNEDSIEK